MNTIGRFITLEGGEGAGKSTQARFIRDWLQAQHRSVVLTREPGGSPLAEAIRGLVLNDWEEGIAPATEALLMFAARAAHVRSTILPALRAGSDVICDRFTDSSYAYQGAGKGVDESALAALESLSLEGLRPDLTLIFDLPPSVGLARAQARGDANRFEAETLEFMERVRAGFLRRAAQQPQRYAIVDAAADQAAVQQAVVKILESRL